MTNLPFIRILVIDADEESYRHAYEMFMAASKEKYLVDRATTYEEAMQLIRKKEHDIYLVDSAFGSPGKSGIDLVRESMELGCTAPHVMLMKNESEPLPDEFYDVGVMNRLVKNKLTPHELENTMRLCLKHSKVVGEIKKRNTELEGIVQLRTAQLNQKIIELEESKKLVEAALGKEKELNGLKSRLMLMVMHEFRTPLGIILSSSELIVRYIQTDQQKDRERHISRIKTNIHHLSAVLDDFILLDQSDTDATQGQKKVVEIETFCKRAIEALDDIVPGKPDIIYMHTGTTRSAFLDERLLGTVIRHLLLNAIKYSAGKPQIEFSSSLKDNMLEICITDHGIGIPESEQKHIFERFFRAKNALNIPGTGIGLNLVSSYVNKMNGTITFHSVEGEGSKFKLVFPGVHE